MNAKGLCTRSENKERMRKNKREISHKIFAFAATVTWCEWALMRQLPNDYLIKNPQCKGRSQCLPR